MNHEHDQYLPKQPPSPSQDEATTGEKYTDWGQNAQRTTGEEGTTGDIGHIEAQMRSHLYSETSTSSGQPRKKHNPWDPMTYTSLDELIHMLATPKDHAWQQRAAALRALPRFGNQVSTQTLLEGLYDPDAHVRVAALEAIGTLAHLKPVSTSIIAANLSDPEPSVQAMAIWALSNFPGSLSVPALIRLTRMPDIAPEVRIATFSALYKDHTQEAITYLQDTLNDSSEDWSIQETLIQLFASDSETLPTAMLLTKAQASHVAEMVRIAAIDALLTRTSEYSTILDYLNSTLVHDDAVVTAAKNAEASILEYYMNVAANPFASADQRKQAITILSRFNQVEMLPEEALSRLLLDDDEEISKVAAYALNKRAQRTLRWSNFHTDTLVTNQQRLLRASQKREAKVTFYPVEPSQLTGLSFFIVQALDIYYIALEIAATFVRKKVEYKDISRYIEDKIRAEYIRSLITMRITILPLESLYNIPALARDFLHGETARNAFKELLRQQVIVPYLHNQSAPDSAPSDQEWDAVTLTAFTAWQRICNEVSMACLRFSWGDNSNQQQIQRFNNTLYKLLEAAQLNSIVEYLIPISTPHHPQRTAIEQLKAAQQKLLAYIQQAQAGTVSREPTRERLYQQVVLANRNTIPGKKQFFHDAPALQPDGLAMKMLIDLAHHVSLADNIQGNLLTPAGLPTRTLLADPPGEQEQDNVKTFVTFQSLARPQNFFRPFSAGFYIRSLSALNLQDVLRIRASKEWQNYANTLDKTLNQPFTTFLLHANELYQNYVILIQYITDYLTSQLDFSSHEENKAYWNPQPAFEIEFGGAKVCLSWEETGITCITSGNKLPEIGEQGSSVPYTVSFHIGTPTDATVEGADIALSFEVERGWLAHPHIQWQALLAQLTAIVGRDHMRYETTSYRGAVINLRRSN